MFECIFQAFVLISTAFSNNEGRQIINEVLYDPPFDPDQILRRSNMYNSDQMEALYQK
jgi:hypothetical protein